MKYLHTMVRVTDLDASMDFFCNKLGLKEVERYDYPEYRFTLVMLAGLMSLPREPFEAAVMDGARPVQVFRDVTLPILRPIIALVLLLRSIEAFKEFDKVFILTGGGPGTATELLSIYTYRVNFKSWDLGYGATCAFMVYLVVLILCSILYKALYWREARATKTAGAGP